MHFRHRLLPTSPDDVPAEIVEALRSFCADSPEVEAGFVCAASIEREGEEPKRRLSFCAKLTWRVDTPEDSRETSCVLAERLAAAHPELMREVGCGVMADRALAVWRQNGIEVFRRGDGV